MAIERIAVVGATGVQGHPVVDAGLEAGMQVRALSRRAAAAEKRLSSRVEVVEADLLEREDLEYAFEGIEGVYFHLPLLPEDADPAAVVDNVIAAARSASVQRLVFSTGAWCGPTLPASEFVDGLRGAAEAVLGSGLEAVVLRPTLYLANLVWPHLIQEIRNTGRLRYPPLDPDRPVTWTATEDQGQIAVACMNAEVAGETFDVVCPEPVTGMELARLVGEAYDREVHFQPESVEEFAESIARLSGSPRMGQAMGRLYADFNRLPPHSLVLDPEPLRRKLGRETTPVEEWVRERLARLVELYG